MGRGEEVLERFVEWALFFAIIIWTTIGSLWVISQLTPDGKLDIKIAGYSCEEGVCR